MDADGRNAGRGLANRVSTRGRIAALLAAPAAAAGLARSAVGSRAEEAGGRGGATTQDLGLPAYNSVVNVLDNGPANPYGSSFEVRGLKGFVTDVNLILKGFRHDRPSDVSVMLDHGGRAAVVMRNASDGTPIRGANLLFNDEATTPLPPPAGVAGTAPLEGGRAYQPRDYNPGVIFGGGAPGPSSTSPFLSTFDGLTPNGQWVLWVRDDVALIGGTLTGWQLEIVTDDPAGTVVVVDNYRTRRDRTLVVDRERGLLARDKGEPNSGFRVRVAAPPRGRLRLREDGSFTYKPTGNRRRDSFTYTIFDEFGSSIEGNGLVNIRIDPDRR